jgi:hypothetical protein
VNETAAPTVLSVKPELRVVTDRAALGLLAFTVSTEGLGTMELAKVYNMSVDKGCMAID